MSTFRNPVGPQPSSVYWRRRLVLGLGILAVIVVIVLIVVGPGAASNGKGGPAPSTSSTPKAEEPVSNEPKACAKGVVDITAITNKAGFDADDKPELSMSIENSGAVACLFDVGADVQEYTIKTGDQLVWNSTHCQAAAQPSTVTLEPGKVLESEPIVWDRTKSSKDTCEGDRPAATAGGASYHLTVTVNGVSSKSQQFVLY